MKALVYTGVEQLEYRDVADATCMDGQALVRVEASGICGSDMHAYLGHDERRPAPLILGHEAAGVIVDGENSGKRVTINPLVSCGSCSYCTTGRTNLCPQRQIISMPPREGAFAQYVAIRKENLVEIPDGVAVEAAALTEPLACGWHAVRLASEALFGRLPDAQCVVLGGGAIGVGAALCLSAFGARSITVLEPNALRRERLQSETRFVVCDPASKSAPPMASAELVIDAVGIRNTRASASKLVQPGGLVLHIGLGDNEGGLDVRRMTLQEIQFIGTYTYTDKDFRDTAQAIFESRLGALDWIEKRPLSDGLSAFRDIRNGEAASPKIILIPEH